MFDIRIPCVTFLLATLAAYLPAVATAQAAEPITVEVSGGRTFTGLVDRQTDDQRLWLRFEEGTGTLWRPVTWQRIARASHQGQDVPLDDLQQLAQRLASTRQIVLEPQKTEPVAPQPVKPSPPAALDVEAALGNWDADVEADGLRLWLRLLDEQGLETTAAGTLEVELFAPRIRKYHEGPQSRGYLVDLIERWTVPLPAESFRRGTAVVRLPFGALHPEFDRGIDALGLVHVRLALPGHGVLEQSLDGVPLRPFSPVRDALLDNTGRRFLPTEATGRGEGAYEPPRY
jgi:hypothetical protein